MFHLYALLIPSVRFICAWQYGLDVNEPQWLYNGYGEYVYCPYGIDGTCLAKPKVYPTMRATCEIVTGLPEPQNLCHYFEKSVAIRHVQFYSTPHSQPTTYKLTFSLNEIFEPEVQAGILV